LNHDLLIVNLDNTKEDRTDYTQTVNPLIAQLGLHGAMKNCRNGASLGKYLATKLTLFTNDQMSRDNFMGKKINSDRN
jgi:hypothetical protein